MKSAVIEVAAHYSAGDNIDFVFLQRDSGSTVPHLCGNYNNVLPDDLDPTSKFSRLSTAPDITHIIMREAESLEKAARLAASSQDDSLPYIELAQQALGERAAQAKLFETPPSDAVAAAATASTPSPSGDSLHSSRETHYDSHHVSPRTSSSEVSSVYKVYFYHGTKLCGVLCVWVCCVGWRVYALSSQEQTDVILAPLMCADAAC
jgi:hypothetical protein